MAAPSTFGDFLRILRAENRMTRSALADRAHISGSYLAKLEQGRANGRPSQEALSSLVNALDLPPEQAHALFELAGWPGINALPADYAEIPPIIPPDIPNMAMAMFDTFLTPLSSNRRHREMFPGAAESPSYADWHFFDPRARMVNEEWEAEARRLVWWMRQGPGSRDGGALQEITHKRLMESFDYARLWNDPTSAVERTRGGRRLLDPTTFEVHSYNTAVFRQVEPSSLVSHYLYIVTRASGDTVASHSPITAFDASA